MSCRPEEGIPACRAAGCRGCSSGAQLTLSMSCRPEEGSPACRAAGCRGGLAGACSWPCRMLSQGKMGQALTGLAAARQATPPCWQQLDRQLRPAGTDLSPSSSLCAPPQEPEPHPCPQERGFVHSVRAQRPVLLARAAGPCLHSAPAKSPACTVPRKYGQMLSSSQLSLWGGQQAHWPCWEAPTARLALTRSPPVPVSGSSARACLRGRLAPHQTACTRVGAHAAHSRLHHEAALPVHPCCSLHGSVICDCSRGPPPPIHPPPPPPTPEPLLASIPMASRRSLLRGSSMAMISLISFTFMSRCFSSVLIALVMSRHSCFACCRAQQVIAAWQAAQAGSYCSAHQVPSGTVPCPHYHALAHALLQTQQTLCPLPGIGAMFAAKSASR